MIRALFARLFRERDLCGMPLPLYLRRAEGPKENPPAVAYCSKCGVVYMTRPVGSALPEDGRCRSCVVGAKVVPIRRHRRLTGS